MPTKTSRARKPRERDTERAIIDKIQALRQEIADAELWKTYQAMDSVVKAIGWEIAERHTGSAAR